MIARWITVYYSKPRNKFMLVVGALLIAPVLNALKADIKRYESKVEQDTILLGKLELTGKMIHKRWEECQ